MIVFIILDLLIILSQASFISESNLSLFSLILKNVKNEILIHILGVSCSIIFFLYASYSFGKIKSSGRKYSLAEGNQTNTLGLLTYCQKLSSISFPLGLNIFRELFPIGSGGTGSVLSSSKPAGW